jgi:hypothetical protein
MNMAVEPIRSNMAVEPISVFAQLGLAQPGAVAVSQDVATELALWEIAMDSAGVGTTDDPFAAALLNQPATFTDTIIDPATLSFMFRVVDVQTGNVLSEEPVGAQLQLQELARLIVGGSTPAEVQATAAINIQA